MADQNFGVDLEARARSDRKRVPILVTTLLTYLDNRKILTPLQLCPNPNQPQAIPNSRVMKHDGAFGSMMSRWDKRTACGVS